MQVSHTLYMEQISVYVIIGSNHLQNLTIHFCQVTFLCEVKFFIQNRYSMKIHYSLLSYALTLFRHQLKNVSGKIIYIDYIV